jgi:hypothetical protein
VRGDVSVDSDALLVTNFMNLKIKPTQSFEGAHRGQMYMRVLIEVSAHTCMSICVCTVLLKKSKGLTLINKWSSLGITIRLSV